MADSILCSINMAGGAINIYYDTILAQNSLSYQYSIQSVSLPNGWKVVIIMSARYEVNSGETLFNPFPIFTNTNSFIYMPAITSSGQIATYRFAYISSNNLYINERVSASYIVAA